MARILAGKCRVCRRENEKLFLKGPRCSTAKCAVEKKARVPGQHGAKRIRLTDYGKHLRETQKLKRLYGISQRQLKRYFADALRQIGNTGDNLLIMLESRLDNVLYLGGFAPSRISARQLIGHGHIKLNGQRASIPSIQVDAGNVIAPAANETSVGLVKKHRELTAKNPLTSTWLKASDEPLQIQVLLVPKRTDIVTSIDEQMVVEYCSI